MSSKSSPPWTFKVFSLRIPRYNLSIWPFFFFLLLPSNAILKPINSLRNHLQPSLIKARCSGAQPEPSFMWRQISPVFLGSQSNWWDGASSVSTRLDQRGTFQRRMIMWEFAFEKTFVLYHNHSYDARFNHGCTVQSALNAIRTTTAFWKYVIFHCLSYLSGIIELLIKASALNHC